MGAEGEPTCHGGGARGGGVGAEGEPTPQSDGGHVGVGAAGSSLLAGETGEVGGELSAPSSWPMMALSAGDCAFLFFIALVRTAGLLLAGGRLPAAGRGGDAATAAYEEVARGVLTSGCCCCKLTEMSAAAAAAVVCVAGLLLVGTCCRSLGECRAGSCCCLSLLLPFLLWSLSWRFRFGLRFFFRPPAGAAAVDAAAAIGRLRRETYSPSCRCSTVSFDHWPAATH